MSASLEVLSATPGVTVQDRGRPGWRAQGLSPGGAMDPLALAEGAALLGHDPAMAALEMAGAGGRFAVRRGGLVIALTGAPMAARAGGRRLIWNATHRLEEGDVLEIGGADSGQYGYLSLPGGLDLPERLGGRGAHLSAGLGGPVARGTSLRPLSGGGGRANRTLSTVPERFSSGTIRVLAGAQTDLFSAEERARFEATEFRKDARASRAGARLAFDGAPFRAAHQLDITSEAIVPGDIQLVGDGTPFVLFPECQTMGGYPRLGTVISADLAIVAQAPPGATLRFRFVLLDEALQARRARAVEIAGLPDRIVPLSRDPHDMTDLLSYELISGAISGAEEEGK